MPTAQRARFVEGCGANDISPAKASELFDLIGQSKPYRLASELCRTKLVPIDATPVKKAEVGIVVDLLRIEP